MNAILTELITRYPQLDNSVEDIQQAFETLCECYERDGAVYLCGNGGSAADAEHIVGELMKSFTARRPIAAKIAERIGNSELSSQLQGALRAVALTGHPSLSSAVANDVNPDLVFAQQVFGYGRRGDVLWGLSTSGNSNNVVLALTVARAKDMVCLGLTGKDGGEMVDRCDVCIRVPESETYKIQELHLPVYHAICRMLEARFFDPSSASG